MQAMGKRRVFWGLLTLLSLAAGCSDGGRGKKTPAADAGALPDGAAEADGSLDDASIGADGGAPFDQSFRVYEELQARLRTSPDHRMARADALVAAGDPVAIFEFVRDQIRAIPALRRAQQFQPFDQRMLFGARGTLWGGVGTPRDKVELLKWLLERAGFAARVKAGFADDTHAEPLLMFRAIAAPEHKPQVSDADLSRWGEWFGAEVKPKAYAVTDPDGVAAALVADQLLALVAPVAPLSPLPDLGSSRIPLLEVDLPGGATYANPLFADLTLGQTGTGNLIVDSPASETASTSVRVFARHTDYEDPEGQTLVEGTWPDADLIGRRVAFRMRPAMDLSELLVTRVDQVQAFLPSLSVEGWELPTEEGTAALRMGPLVTLGGEVVEQTDDARIKVSGERLQSTEGEAERFASVARLELAVDARHFPKVRVDLSPLTSEGAIVPGLRGEHFILDEDGVAVSGTLRSNQVVPRVLFLADRSTSVPEAFRGAALKSLGLEIAEGVFANPDGEAAMMFIGETRAQYQPYTSDPDVLGPQFDRTAGGGSRLYSALADAVRRRPSVVVMITDGVVVGETLSPALADDIRRAGVPAVVLGVGTQQTNVLTELATLSGGTYVSVADATAARTAVASFLQSDAKPYELVYRAPREGASSRTLRVRTRDERLSAQVTFEVPAAPYSAGGFVGVYMTITRDGESVTRTLAGLPRDVPIPQASAALIEQVEASFFGASSLLIEGGTPSWSQVVDEQLGGMLSLRGMWEAQGDPDAFRAELNKGFWSMPFAAVRQMFGAMTVEAAATPMGPRFVLYTERPAPVLEDSERRVDMLPMTRWLGVAATEADAFRAALRRSVIDAVLEANYYERSTIAALSSETLQAVPAETLSTHFAGAANLTVWERSAEAFEDDWTLLVPSDGAPVAFWAVHEPSGTALAILEGGGGAGAAPGGGGMTSRAVSAVETLAYLHSLTGLGGGIWLNLEVAKAKQVAYATMAIASMGSDLGVSLPPDLAPGNTIAGFICGEAENAVVDGLPPPIKIAIATYNRYASAQGHPKVCP